jgi:hypothetical protein
VPPPSGQEGEKFLIRSVEAESIVTFDDDLEEHIEAFEGLREQKPRKKEPYHGFLRR